MAYCNFKELGKAQCPARYEALPRNAYSEALPHTLEAEPPVLRSQAEPGNEIKPKI